MEEDKVCILGQSLGLGESAPKKENMPAACLDLTFELCPKGKANDDKGEGFSLKRGQEQDPRPNEKYADNTNNKNSSRKKLKLTNEQSVTLEDCFKLHKTINPAQKRELAEQLNLKRRQVEVWFQNRRARTKLKQTEVDCEFLKKCCENLTEENLRLKMELQPLRALKVGPSPPCPQLSNEANLTLCSSCEELLKLNEGNNSAIYDVVRNNNR